MEVRKKSKGKGKEERTGRTNEQGGDENETVLSCMCEFL